MNTQANSNDLERAAAIIRSGGLVGMPTETVYGLAADATNDRAVARIFEAKGRPQFNPLIIHVTGAEMAAREVEISPLAQTLMDVYWPGPLTLVLPRRKDSAISLLVSAGLDTVGVRAPAHPLARALIAEVDRPLAAPSANRSGTISPTRAADVRDSLGDRVDLVLDGGACAVGLESTIVKVDGDTLTRLRPGSVTREALAKSAGRPISDAHGAIEAPGMMASHYAPNAKLRLHATGQSPDEAYLGFGPLPEGAAHALNLSESGDLVEAAANLFAHLRALDRLCAEKNLVGIAAAPIPAHGLGEAINDRLARASAPR